MHLILALLATVSGLEAPVAPPASGNDVEHASRDGMPMAELDAHLNAHKGAGFTSESLKAHMKDKHLEHFTKKHAQMMRSSEEGFGARMVGILDENNDKLLTIDEIRGTPGREKGAYAGMMTGGAAWYSQADKFKEADTNADQKLSSEEMMGHHEKAVTVDFYMGMVIRDLMQATDKDKDNVISEGEFLRHRRVFKEHFTIRQEL
jgi:hypothetical protein